MDTNNYIALAEWAMRATEREGWAADTFRSPVAMPPDYATPATPEVEWHPLLPFLPPQTRILFLGSFPPQHKRWCMEFFYPNFINDHWRIEGQVFFDDAGYFVDAQRKTFRLRPIVEHLKARGIGFFDTALAVRRLADNASDKYLEVVVPTDIRAMVEHLPELRAIVTTGKKATDTIAAQLPLHDIELCRLPSSSRAYPMALAQKAEAYRQMFKRYL